MCYVLHSSLPYSSVGYATRAQGLAQGLAAAGVDVLCMTRPGYPLNVASIETPDAVPERETIDEIEYIRLLPPLLSTIELQCEYIGAAANELAKAFERERPQWVMAASNYVTGMAAMIAARRLESHSSMKCVASGRSRAISRDPAFARTGTFRTLKLLEAGVAQGADHVFTLTSPMRDELVKRGVAPEKITLLPNSCDPVIRASSAERWDRTKAEHSDGRACDRLYWNLRAV